MAVINTLLLVVLFVAGLIHLFFYFPTKKLYSYLQTLIFPIKEIKSVRQNISRTPERTPNHKEISELKRVFGTFDKNDDGFITKQELMDSLKNIRIFMSEKEVEEMVKKVDANGDGLIDFEEFCTLMYEYYMVGDGDGDDDDRNEEGNNNNNNSNKEDELKEAFGVFDKDRDGLITVHELGLVLSSLGLKEGKKIEDCKEMIRKVDLDGDGMVNFDEFKKMMRSGGLRLNLCSRD